MQKICENVAQTHFVNCLGGYFKWHLKTTMKENTIMGKSQRAKGSRGQCTAANMLRDRDWEVEVLTCGMMHEDLIATECATPFDLPTETPKRYSVEIKKIGRASCRERV